MTLSDVYFWGGVVFVCLFCAAAVIGVLTGRDGGGMDAAVFPLLIIVIGFGWPVVVPVVAVGTWLEIRADRKGRKT